MIGDSHDVVAALFTTFNFEPDFFEEEIVPLLLNQDLAFSSDKVVKTFQVRQALNEAQIPIEIFYDANIFQLEADRAPEMEYLHHGVNDAPNAFHGKVSLILLRETKTGQQTLLVSAGSANLTQAGWWENIECQHWETISDRTAPEAFRNSIQADLDLLEEQRQAATPTSGSALDRIKGFVAACSGSDSSAPVHYYGLAGQRRWGQLNGSPFVSFLRQALNAYGSDQTGWNLEIISPYFAEDAHFNGHRQLANAINAHHIQLFLPTNDHNEALCTKAYYQAIDNENGIVWATWSTSIAKALGTDDKPFRRSHAKLYHFYNERHRLVFTGSVNFSYKAFHDNIEAGFLTEAEQPQPLLTPLDTPQQRFCDPEDLFHERIGQNSDQQTADIQLVYDWKLDRLTGCVAEPSEVVIDLLTPEGRPFASSVRLTRDFAELRSDTKQLRNQLNQYGAIKVNLLDSSDSREVVGEQHVLIQQINWTHKPLNLPHLTPQQIIEIYAGLSFERRNQLIAHLKEIQLHNEGLISQHFGFKDYKASGQQFFCEYAELFQAFRNIRRRIKQALDDGNGNLVDYYLTGCGIDSLPALFDSLFENNETTEPVTHYLTLLCLRQMYTSVEFRDCYGVSTQLACINSKIRDIETSDELELTDRNAKHPAAFYKWFRYQFFKPYETNQ